EPDEGNQLNTSIIKRVTGEDTITARFMYKGFFDFKPVFKLFYSCNRMPPIPVRDNAIWERVKPIPFDVSFKGREDRTLQDTLLRELEGILAWIVRGCVEWQQEGLAYPEEVTEARDDLRRSVDRFQDFLDDRCVTGPTCKVGAERLYTCYRAWSEANGEQ